MGQRPDTWITESSGSDVTSAEADSLFVWMNPAAVVETDAGGGKFNGDPHTLRVVRIAIHGDILPPEFQLRNSRRRGCPGHDARTDRRRDLLAERRV